MAPEERARGEGAPDGQVSSLRQDSFHEHRPGALRRFERHFEALKHERTEKPNDERHDERMKTRPLKYRVKIRRGVPLPPPRSVKSAWLQVLSRMQPGDSITLPTATLRCSALRTAKRHGYRFTSRKLNGEGWGLWLISCPGNKKAALASGL